MYSWESNSNNSSEFPSIRYDVSPENIKKPPFWPLIAQIISILASIVIYFLSPRGSYLLWSLIGYLFTPFIVFAALALQRAKDLNARSNAFYDLALGKKYLQIAGILGLASFLVAIPIVIRLATEISQR